MDLKLILIGVIVVIILYLLWQYLFVSSTVLLSFSKANVANRLPTGSLSKKLTPLTDLNSGSTGAFGETKLVEPVPLKKLSKSWSLHRSLYSSFFRISEMRVTHFTSLVRAAIPYSQRAIEWNNQSWFNSCNIFSSVN